MGIIVFGVIWGMVGWPQTDTSLHRIMFYNVENLFHPSDDSLKADDDFTPTGSYHWTYKKYYLKISMVGKVIVAAGMGDPPWLVGLADRDSCVRVLRSRKIPVVFPFDTFARNRDILYAVVQFPSGDSLHVFVNHWTSRYGGYAATVPKRNEYADVVRRCVDSLIRGNPRAKILITGDFNDFVEVDFREDNLFCNTKREVSVSIKTGSFDTAEILNTRQCNISCPTPG